MPYDFDYGLASVTKIELADDGLDVDDNQSTELESKLENPPVLCKTEPDWPSGGDSVNSSEPPAKRKKSKKSSSSSSKKRKVLSKKYERYDSIVECDGCGTVMRKSQLERHFISKHYKGLSYSCHHCPYFKTLTRTKILAHLYTSHFVSDNQCKQCQKVLPNYRSLQTHLEKHREAAIGIQCEGCKQRFSRHQTYYLHIKANPLLFNCTECELGFHTVRALDKHLEKTHKKVYTCPICQLPLHLLLTYDTHMWKQHGVRTKPRCRYCGKEFESTEQLAAHSQSEHKPLKDKNVVCEVCGKKYDTQYKLAQHIRNTHRKTTGQLFPCPQCPKQYKGKIALNFHIKRVHLNERPADSKLYPCTKCSLTFLKRQFLEGHMLCHNTENRPFFQCMQCGIAYTRRQKLEVHKNKCPNRVAPQFPAGMY
jgi:Drought induced 19 protein (Di19), zinc-binding